MVRLMATTLRPWLALTVVCGLFSLNPTFRTTFWSLNFLLSVPQQAATNIVLSAGMTCVIICGGIDLSVGSVLALSSITTGLMVTSGVPTFIVGIMSLPIGILAMGGAFRAGTKRIIPLVFVGSIAFLVSGLVIGRLSLGGIQLEGAILAAMMVGAGAGVTNGLLVSIGKVPAFVVTLGMFTAARGLAVFATGGNSVSGLPKRLALIGEGLPLICLSLGVVCVVAFVLSKTRLGRYWYAIGGNEDAARLSGVEVTYAKTMAFVACSICAAIASVLLTAKFMVADTGAGAGAELNAIAAVVIGGTSLSGGRGSAVGSLVGALTIAVLNAALVLVGVPDTLQGVVIGGVIVTAVLVDRLVPQS